MTDKDLNYNTNLDTLADKDTTILLLNIYIANIIWKLNRTLLS